MGVQALTECEMPTHFNPKLDSKDRKALKAMRSMDDMFTIDRDGNETLSDAGLALVKALYTDPATKKLPPRQHTIFELCHSAD